MHATAPHNGPAEVVPHAIPHWSVPRVRWGDEHSGFVSDWIYWETPRTMGHCLLHATGGSLQGFA